MNPKDPSANYKCVEGHQDMFSSLFSPALCWDIALHSFTSFSFPVCPSDPYYNKLSRYGHYQNPTNPSTFYQCAKGYNEPFTMPCPAYPNTAFNPFKDQCDYKCPESKELAEELKDCFPVTDNTEAKIVALTGRSIWK